jgi:FkbM family methyltransferase
VGLHPALQAYPGWQLRCHPAVHRSLTKTQLADPEQVQELADFIDACCPGMALFDLGAHFGVFSLAAARFGGAEARAIAIEPSATACRILGIQARLNGAAERVSVVRAAASDRPGSLQMLPVGVIADGYFVAADRDHPATEGVPVRTVSIDSLVADLDLSPTHVKIDVEGAEAAVLRGGSATLSGHPAATLFIELHNRLVSQRGDDPAAALDLLANYGYRELTEAGRTLSRDEVLQKPLIRVVARK